MSDDRTELARLVRDVRRHVDRERKIGRSTIVDPALTDWLAQEARRAPAPGASGKGPAEGPRLVASGRVTSPRAQPLPAAPPAAGRAPLPKAPPLGPVEPVSRSGGTALPPVAVPADDTRDLAAMTAALESMRVEASTCPKCGLCEGRTQVVFSGGTARHGLMFVGEAPGFHEDQQGVPFVGRAGQLLTDIITAMGFDRNDVYIANVLKCRPPENRDPLPHEIEACWPWLERQIELVRPRVLCTLGKYSAQLLTGAGPKATIGTLRGKVFHYKGIPVVPTYHPAFLLRSPSFKRAAWEDVKLVREIYLAPPGATS